MKTFLEYINDANHLPECASHEVDGPNANDACNCGLERIQCALRFSPLTFASLIDTVIDLGECLVFMRHASAELRGRYQVNAADVERAALAMEESVMTIGKLAAIKGRARGDR